MPKTFDFELIIESPVDFDRKLLFSRLCDCVHKIVPTAIICGGKSSCKELIKSKAEIKKLKKKIKKIN